LKVYADSSLLVSAFTTEAASEAARASIAGLPEGALFTSRWCQTEVASALALKARRGELPTQLWAQILHRISDLLVGAATFVPIHDALFLAAGEMIERSALPLRGPDALHLAIAQSGGASVWTLDKEMAAAGQAFGLDVRLLA
jgi:hypothetical protein